MTGADGGAVLANRPFAHARGRIGLGLDGVFADRLLELADRTAEPYAFTAAVERLGESGRVDRVRGRGGRPGLRAARVGARSRARAGLDAARGHRGARAAAGPGRVRRDGRRTSCERRSPRCRASSSCSPTVTPGRSRAEQMRYVEIVQRATGRLHALVDELLERSDERETTKKGRMIAIVGGGLRPRSWWRATARPEAATRSSSGRRIRTGRITARRSRSGCSAASPPRRTHSSIRSWYAEQDVELRAGRERSRRSTTSRPTRS